MSLMTQRDKWMFAKYYGRMDLAGDDLFWKDVSDVYHDTNIPLPMPVKPEAVRQFFDGFECERCGECCKYQHTAISQREINRIKESSEANSHLISYSLEEYEGGQSIKYPCPFLNENFCSIYKIRPHACYFFPLQLHVGNEIEVDGKKQSVMFCRVKCSASLKAIRAVVNDMMKQSDKFILLPNLNITSTNMIKSSAESEP